MRPFPHLQYWSDWLTQYWNIVFGRRAAPGDAWLLGPTGQIGKIGESIIGQIALAEGLAVVREATAGLIGPDFFYHGAGGEAHPDIVEFYTKTSQYDMDAWTRWEPVWGILGRLVDVIFARRVDQLRLPTDALATSKGISSEIIQFKDSEGLCRHTLWLRKLKPAGSVIYAGFYYQVTDSNGEPRVKVVFPLPHGSATVVMSSGVLDGGRVRLSSAGKRFGDPGFYFVVNDRHGGTWIRYLRHFHEFIEVWADGAGGIRADHTMRLWGRLCYSLHYRVLKKANSER